MLSEICRYVIDENAVEDDNDEQDEKQIREDLEYDEEDYDGDDDAVKKMCRMTGMMIASLMTPTTVSVLPVHSFVV